MWYLCSRQSLRQEHPDSAGGKKDEAWHWFPALSFLQHLAGLAVGSHKHKFCCAEGNLTSCACHPLEVFLPFNLGLEPVWKTPKITVFPWQQPSSGLLWDTEESNHCQCFLLLQHHSPWCHSHILSLLWCCSGLQSALGRALPAVAPLSQWWCDKSPCTRAAEAGIAPQSQLIGEKGQKGLQPKGLDSCCIL